METQDRFWTFRTTLIVDCCNEGNNRNLKLIKSLCSWLKTNPRINVKNILKKSLKLRLNLKNYPLKLIKLKSASQYLFKRSNL